MYKYNIIVLGLLTRIHARKLKKKKKNQFVFCQFWSVCKWRAWCPSPNMPRKSCKTTFGWPRWTTNIPEPRWNGTISLKRSATWSWRTRTQRLPVGGTLAKSSSWRLRSRCPESAVEITISKIRRRDWQTKYVNILYHYGGAAGFVWCKYRGGPSSTSHNRTCLIIIIWTFDRSFREGVLWPPKLPFMCADVISTHASYQRLK